LMKLTKCLFIIINIGLSLDRLEELFMNTDNYFAMGKSHMICEDYAYSGLNSAGNYVAVVSDGCSASSDTDFGSRFLVRSSVICGAQTKHNIYNYEEALIRSSIWCASQAYKGLRLSSECLDATLLYLEVMNEYVSIVTAGDGVIFAINKNDELEYWNIEYPSGAPFYPSYLLDEKRYDKYVEECGVSSNIQYFSVKNERTWQHDGMFHTMSFDKKDYKFVGVASDGVLTCDMPIEQTLIQLTSFKNTKGDFVKRRMRRFLKDCVKNNTYPTDDISMAVAYLGEN